MNYIYSPYSNTKVPQKITPSYILITPSHIYFSFLQQIFLSKFDITHLMPYQNDDSSGMAKI